jgi:hypothetical protein
MPNFVKVGFSTKDPELRAKELDTTGLPHPFKVAYEILVNEPRDVEQLAHKILKNNGFHENKEFFNCSIEVAIASIRKAAKGEIILENIHAGISSESIDDDWVDEDDDWVDELVEWAKKNGISEKDLPRNKEELLTITKLDLSDRVLVRLPESIGNLTALNNLDLSVNKLTNIPVSIGNLIALESLDLHFNKLVSLPESIGNLTALKRLNLCYNELVSIPKSICNLTALEFLSLGTNKQPFQGVFRG